MNKKDIPFISVGITTYKRSHRLKDLLSTLEKQNVKSASWEIVISDNNSADETGDVVRSFLPKLPNIKYFVNKENIGGDRNLKSLFDKATGKYVWILPDDDNINGTNAIEEIICKIKACPILPTFVLLNAKSIFLDTNKVYMEKMSSIYDDIFLYNGKDILNVVSDFDLIGAQRLIVQRDVMPNTFVDQYPKYVTIIAIALVACTKGPALIIGYPYSIFGAGDQSPWRKEWSSICLQIMPNLLLDAKNVLNYDQDLISNMIRRRKYDYFDRTVAPHRLVFQLYGMSWRSLTELYGRNFVFLKIVKNLFLILPYFIYKFLFRYDMFAKVLYNWRIKKYHW